MDSSVWCQDNGSMSRGAASRVERSWGRKSQAEEDEEEQSRQMSDNSGKDGAADEEEEDPFCMVQAVITKAAQQRWAQG
jgi:hypothetical protein